MEVGGGGSILVVGGENGRISSEFSGSRASAMSRGG
jgi:hypothetical protein